MLVFVTGASGLIGLEVVRELRSVGHDVVGLTRSEVGARTLEKSGAQPYFGDLSDFSSIRSGVTSADAVIHLAFDHNFEKFVANCENDEVVVEQLGELLANSSRPLVITSVTALGLSKSNPIALETMFDETTKNHRAATELACLKAQAAGTAVRAVRLSQVHDTSKHGLITFYVEIARKTGIAVYVGDGGNPLAAVHKSDAAELYRSALDEGKPGACYNAVGETGVTGREIAKEVGARLGIPTVSLSAKDSPAHFGWFSMFAHMDQPASNEWAQQMLPWKPTGPGLIANLHSI